LKGREEDERDVSSYWMALINRDDTEGSTRTHSVENSLWSGYGRVVSQTAWRR